MQCQCPTDGHCPMLGRNMPPHLHHLCRTREDYRDLFIKQAREAGRLSLPVIQNTGPVCIHRGESLGTLTTPFGTTLVHGCSKHIETTLPQCETCSDRCEDGPSVSSSRKLADILPSSGKGPRIYKWAVGMVTAPRKEETFTQSMRSLIAAGWDSPHIFAEPGSPIPDEFRSLPLTQRGVVAGCWPNFYLALQELLTLHPDADAFMVAQDDVLFARGDANENLRQFLERSLWPDDQTGCVSIYCSAAYHQEKQDWHRFQGKWLWGALAFIWPRESLIHFLGHNGLMWRYADKRTGGLRRSDRVVGNWHVEHQKSMWYCSPSLVQHIGNTSTIYGPGNKARGKRAAKQFVETMK